MSCGDRSARDRMDIDVTDAGRFGINARLITRHSIRKARIAANIDRAIGFCHHGSGRKATNGVPCPRRGDGTKIGENDSASALIIRINRCAIGDGIRPAAHQTDVVIRI